MNTLSNLLLLNSGETFALLIKVTLLFATAAATAALLRHAAAAVRHLVWTLALGGSVALVALTPTAPRIVVAVPVTPTTQSTLLSAARRNWLQAAPGPVLTGAAIDVGRLDASSPPSPTAHGTRAWLAAHLTTLLLATWLAGALLIVAHCIAGHVAVARLVARGRGRDDLYESAALHSARALGVRRPVRLVVSREVTTPMTSGLRRPVVILPVGAARWSPERLQVVLIHELAHVARLDYLTQLIGTLARALLWFHPGVWFAVARLRAEGEHAADDQVLAAGLPGVNYAAHLVELARQRIPASLPATVAVGMARSSHLEGRLRAMLDSTRSRATVSPRRQLAAAVAALCIMIPLAGLRTRLVAAPITDRAPTIAAGSVALPTVPAPMLQQESRPARNRSSRAHTDETFGSDSTIERTVSAKAGERLTLDLRTGGEVIVHASGDRYVRLRAELGGENWRETRVSLARGDGGVRLQSIFDPAIQRSSTSHRFELWVPRHFDLQLESAGGSVTIHDLDGDFRGHTGGGRIDIDHASGHSTLATGGGDIKVTDSDLGGTVSTGGGAVTLARVRGGLRGSSGSGPVVYSDGNINATTMDRETNGRIRASSIARGDDASPSRVTTTTRDRDVTITGTNRDRGYTSSTSRGDSYGDGEASGRSRSRSGAQARADGDNADDEDASGRLNISRAGGSISISAAPHGGTVATAGGDIKIGSSHGVLRASSGGGDIELRNVAGDATARTGAGNVIISVTDADGTEHSVSVTSGTGKVTIDLPASLDARFELQTAYTNNFGRRTTISSDWKLDREETSEWDDSDGSPRKYVRAHGTVGNGRGLIRVWTVNGDVVIRRTGR